MSTSLLCTIRNSRRHDDPTWIKLPGLYQRFEFEQVIDKPGRYAFELAGIKDDGTQLWTIYYDNEEAKP